MRLHVFKFTAFASIQLLLMAVVWSFADAPLTLNRDDLASENRLRQTLHCLLYRDWLADAATLDRAVHHGAADAKLRRAFQAHFSVDDGYMAAIVDKDRLLRSAPGRRLILIGGSNLAFGIDGPLLGERYRLTPVNLGMHELLRAGYMLRHTEANLRSGDVVILCLEFGTMFSGAETANPELRKLLCQALPTMADYFEESDDTPWKEFCDRIALAQCAAKSRDVAARCRQSTTRKTTQLLVHGMTSQNKLQQQFDQQFDQAWPQLLQEYHRWLSCDTVYARSGFNAHGDFVGHYGLTSDRALDSKQLSALTASQRSQLARSLAVLNKFVARCRVKEVDVYFAYPPICNANDQFAAQYEAEIAAQCAAPILFPIAAARTNASEHYDSAYHLNWTGIRRRMEVWTTALDRHLPPQVTMTPADHVARRDLSVRVRWAATATTATPIH